MAKFSIDVEELTKNLKSRAYNAKAQLAELAKQAQKDLAEKGVLKKVDQVIETVKSQEFMKNPRVAELAKRIVALSEQIEKVVTKNASQLVDEVRSRVNKTAKAADATAAKAEKVEEKAEEKAATTKKNNKKSAAAKNSDV